MSWKGTVRAIGKLLGGKRRSPRAPTAGEPTRTYFVGVSGRPMRLTVADDTPDALVAATEAGETEACKASGALQLRAFARVNGRLVALHDLDRMRETEGQAQEREALSS